MHLLLITYYFPPYNSIGSVRVGKFARYLTEFGHTISVVSAYSPALEQQDASLPLQIDPRQVTYTRWFDVNAGVRLAAGLAQRSRDERTEGSRHTAITPALDGMSPTLRTLSKLYLSLVNVPDAFWGWQPYAFRAALRLARRERPDVVLASGPPFSAFQVASRLARTIGVPWVADFRDLWADKPQYPFLEWRRRVDRLLERRTMQGAAGQVTVSAPLVDLLSKRYPRVPSELVLNGFDPDDYPATTASSLPGLPLVVRYTGTLFYVGNSDPSLLFQAVQRLGRNRQHIRIEFVLRDFAPRLEQLAKEAGIGQCVRVLPPVPYRRSLELQQQADVLALILPLGAHWDGAFSGKFFEYCGAGRPILAIADASNVAAGAVRVHQLGLASTNSEEIASWLSARIDEKRSSGRIPGLDPRRVLMFTRRAQTERLEAFLRERLAQLAS